MKNTKQYVVAVIRSAGGITHEFAGIVETPDMGGYVKGTDLDMAILKNCADGSRIDRIKEVLKA